MYVVYVDGIRAEAEQAAKQYLSHAGGVQPRNPSPRNRAVDFPQRLRKVLGSSLAERKEPDL